jgi:hypothetical protein
VGGAPTMTAWDRLLPGTRRHRSSEAQAHSARLLAGPVPAFRARTSGLLVWALAGADSPHPPGRTRPSLGLLSGLALTLRGRPPNPDSLGCPDGTPCHRQISYRVAGPRPGDVAAPYR